MAGVQAAPSARISIAANRGVTGFLFALAIITYIIHAYIRARIIKRFSTQDVLLLFAVVCLCGCTGLAFSTVQGHYDSVQVIINTDLNRIATTLDDITRDSKLSNAAVTLWWFVIFPVKLAYMFFFRRLIDRMRYLTIFWWCVVVFTILAGLVCVAVSWLTCPYFTAQEVLLCAGSSASDRAIRAASVVVVMDLVTDTLVVSFPLILLWQVRMNLRQKLGLAVFLCLSIVMGIVAIVRISGIRINASSIDVVWLAFWGQQECSIAVMMVSTSAFRSFFVTNTARSPSREYTPSSWKKRLLHRHPSPNQDDLESSNPLPQIPRATITGVRSAIDNVPPLPIPHRGKRWGSIIRSFDEKERETNVMTPYSFT